MEETETSKQKTERLLKELRNAVSLRLRLNFSGAPGTTEEKRVVERDLLKISQLLVDSYIDEVRWTIPSELDNHSTVTKILGEALGFIEADIHAGRQMSELLVSFYKFLELRSENQ